MVKSVKIKNLSCMFSLILLLSISSFLTKHSLIALSTDSHIVWPQRGMYRSEENSTPWHALIELASVQTTTENCPRTEFTILVSGGSTAIYMEKKFMVLERREKNSTGPMLGPPLDGLVYKPNLS